MSIGTTRLCHIAILVRDLDKAIEHWSKVLGLPKPEPWYLPPPGKVAIFAGGEQGDYSDCRLAVFELENVKIELVQPGPHSGPYWDKLERDGEGVQHISFIVPDRTKAQDTLKTIGAPAPYLIGYFPGATYSFIDTAPQLGVEINIKTDDDNKEKMKKFLTDPDLHKADL
jgi:catechol 2,3-dioxygenase-like lactoylglutathione lyase family enzyme